MFALTRISLQRLASKFQVPVKLRRILVLQEVQVDQALAAKGFDARCKHDGKQDFQISAGSFVTLDISWKPKDAGTVRESLYLKWRGVSKLQVVLHGTALGAMQAGRGRGAKLPASLSQKKAAVVIPAKSAPRYRSKVSKSQMPQEGGYLTSNDHSLV